MKRIIVTVLALSFLGCSGPKTLDVDGQKLTFNSGAWKANEGNSLVHKDDAACWIDLTGDKTSPGPGGLHSMEDLVAAEPQGKAQIYFGKGTTEAKYVSFNLGTKQIFGRIGDKPTECLVALTELANAN